MPSGCFSCIKGDSYESIRFRIGSGRFRAHCGLNAAILAISNDLFSARIVTDDTSIDSRKVQSKHRLDVVVVGGRSLFAGCFLKGERS